MRWTAVLLVLLLRGLTTPAPLVAAAPPAPVPADLVARLGSDTYEERQAATRALDALGGPALPALRAALLSPECEVRHRARILVARLERREQTARVLAPTRLRLVGRNVLVTEAVAELARRSGRAVALADGAAEKLAGRRITLDTGETTFWEALARLEAAAGLVEQHPNPAWLSAERGLPARASRVNYLDESVLGAFRRLDGPVLLASGKAPAYPACYAGALRLRALPSAGPPRGSRPEIALTVEVRPEPRLAWQSAVALYIDHAGDDQGQRLTPAAVELGVSWVPGGEGRERYFVWDTSN